MKTTEIIIAQFKHINSNFKEYFKMALPLILGMTILLSGEKIFDYRMQMLATTFPNFATNGAKRFNYITKDSKEDNMMKKIDDAVKYFRPNVLVVDCLYNCTGGIDMGKDYSLTPVLDSITEMKQKYNLTIPAVHHLNKGLHELGLISDRMRGASNLLFWMEHSVLMCRTNDPFLRLLTRKVRNMKKHLW